MLPMMSPAAWGRAVRYSFSHIDGNDGLSSSCVKTILQDKYGFMWFGTKNGLNRYDGRTIKRYNCYDTEKLRGNNNIGALYEAPDGQLWVGTDRGVFIYDREHDRFSYFDLKAKSGRTPDNWVQDITGDKNGNIWVLDPSRSLFRFKDGVLYDYEIPVDNSKTHNIPVGLFSTKGGDIYVTMGYNGFYRYDKSTDKFVKVGNGQDAFSRLGNLETQMIRQNRDGNLVIATQDGHIFHYDITTDNLIPLPFSKEGNVYVRSLMCVGDEVWLGTHNGLYVFNLISGKETYLTEAADDPCSLSNSTIYYLYPDRDGNVWIGTMFGGVSYFRRQGFGFERYSHTSSSSSLSSNRIRGMAKSPDGLIYVGTEEAGFNIFDPQSGSVSHHDNGGTSLMAKNFGDKVYIGYALSGMDVARNGAAISDSEIEALKNKSDFSNVYSFLIDNHGNRWVGTDRGIFRAPQGSTDYKKVKETGHSWIFDMYQDSRGLIWIADMGNGVWKYNPSTGKYRLYPYDEQYTNGLRSNSVSSVMEDSKGNIWISTDRGGLSRYEVSTDSFKTYSVEEGLPDNVVYDVLEDSNGMFWFGTNSGLVRFNPETAESSVFTTADGLLGNQFNYHSAVAGDDGYFYFGSMNGLVAFNPTLYQPSDSITPVYFTSLRIGGEEVSPTSPDSPLEKDIQYTDEIRLPHDYPGMTIGMSSPNYVNRGAIQFTYRLLPGDDNWLPLNDLELSFVNLPPGKYTLEVKADNGTAYTISRIHIRIDAPWYSTTIAIIIYIILFIAALVLGWSWYRAHNKLQMSKKEQLYKINREKELYENKVSFFTELAHEIRTPISLIDAPLQALHEMSIEDAKVARYLRVMKQNTERLLNLTGQLLDFQKIGADKFEFTFEKVDITQLLTETLDRFVPAMILKGKVVTNSIPSRSIFAVIDREAVTKILSNMLNNAMKYSEKNIHVSLTSTETDFTVRVTSDGEKISAENSLRIFEPFFQVDSKADNNGVGIGLPLCRTLAHLQHGRIEVEETDEETNTFALTLPLQQEGVEVVEPVLTDEMDGYILKENEQKHRFEGEERSYLLLLVEDNEQMRDFLEDQLSQSFVLETAKDGVDALEKIKDHNFDLIVTDIMMPRMDGYELCTAIKSDINRSHIPVVFLTAKNDLDSKLKALQCGGEAFIEKPFSIKYFRQQVLSLLENRRHERKAFLKQPFFSLDNMKLTDADKKFMDKVINIITENIADEKFNVESMADTFCMSRSSLLRKIKILFNLSPIELIRTIRLKKAAELIQENKYRIGDVCFMVGINSSSYFSKLFFKQFGISPKEFEKQCKNKAQSIIASDRENNQSA